MPAQLSEENSVLLVDELRSMAECSGHCISIYLPLTHAGVEPTRWRSALQQVEKLLMERGLTENEITSLLLPVRSFEMSPSLRAAKSVAIFRSASLIRTVPIPWATDEFVSASGHFQIAPLLPLLQRPNQFYILALSQKHVRLLRCTAESAEEVNLPASVPRSIDEGIDEVDSAVDQRSGDVAFGSGSSADRREERLTHFLKQVDRGLCAQLKDDSTPVVLAGVDYESALYRRLSLHPHLLTSCVHGSPDGLKLAELLHRASEIVNLTADNAFEATLQLFEKQGGTGKISTDAANILKAAREGRVSHLLLAKGSEFAESHNAAALQTVVHSGQVHIAPHSRMPEAAVIAALLRY